MFNVKTAPQIPSRRALAGLAVVTVLSTIEKRRKAQEQTKEQREPPLDLEDMSGELQTIPARHGVATFVPRGRTIKVINTYGKQVVSMWAFTLGAPPEDGDEDEPDEEEIEAEAKKLQEVAEKEEGKGDEKETKPADNGKQDSKEKESNEQTTEKKIDEEKEQSKASKSEEAMEEYEDPPEQAPDTPDNEKSTEYTVKSTGETKEMTEKTTKQPSKRTWASYLPSIPYRSKGKGDKAEEKGAEQEPSPEEQKKQDEANTKKWSSYIPTGKGFSSYIPNVEVPSKEGVVSAFKSSHYRDPNKSYAEQLYDFSKTPVGAGTIAGTSPRL
jgi:chemotaxis protein histidine kinase CheA